jgi:putative DNA primase/helicase
VAAIERLARGDHRHAARPEQWDADIYSLNTPGGAIDLRTGEKRKHRPEDYMIKMAAVAPGGDCPRWRQFLGEITNGDTALQQFLQRMAGYSLTGDVSEEALFFLYGTGGNGKGVFMDTTARIMSDYCRNAPFNMFTVSHTERHPTELAMLKDLRMVNSTETKDGRRWDETKLKALTGGDPIVARHMRQDFFEHRPQFTLVIAGNHKPRLSSVDEAIRRRFHLVPFTVTIGPDKRDEGLKEKLKAEWPGILQWMIDGCINWQEFGLAPPKAVTTATAAYLEAEDVVSNWIADCCQVDRSVEDTTKRLYASYSEWAEQSGERPLSKGKLGDALEARGYKRDRTKQARGHVGIKLNEVRT